MYKCTARIFQVLSEYLFISVHVNLDENPSNLGLKQVSSLGLQTPIKKGIRYSLGKLMKILSTLDKNFQLKQLNLDGCQFKLKKFFYSDWPD